MAVTTRNWNTQADSNPDQNSCCIVYEAGDTLFDSVNKEVFPNGSVIKAIHDFLLSRGWEFWDCSPDLAAGTFAYRAPNLADSSGSVSYKYIILDLIINAARIMIKSYEGISEAGVLTNLSINSNNSSYSLQISGNTAGVASSAGKIWLGASARHLVMHTTVGGLYGNPTQQAPCGVFELTRSSALDTVVRGYPKHVWISPIFSDTGTTAQPASIPRTTSGTLTNAVTRNVTTFGAGGSVIGNPTRTDGLMPNALDILTGKMQASNVVIHNPSAPEVLGTMINFIALTRGYGAGIGEDVMLPVSADAAYGNEKFFDPRAGGLTSYWILGGISHAIRFAVPK